MHRKNIYTTIARIVPVLLFVFFLMPGNAEAAPKWYYQGVLSDTDALGNYVVIPYNFCTTQTGFSDPSGRTCTITGATASDNCKTQTWYSINMFDIYRCEEQSGTINVQSNIPTSWQLTGPTGALNTSLITSYTYNLREPGTYTINWGTRSGYVTPPPETIALTNWGNVTLNGNYIATAPACDLGCGGFMRYRTNATSMINDFTAPAGNRLRTQNGSWSSGACSGIFTQNPGSGTFTALADASCSATPSVNLNFVQ